MLAQSESSSGAGDQIQVGLTGRDIDICPGALAQAACNLKIGTGSTCHWQRALRLPIQLVTVTWVLQKDRDRDWGRSESFMAPCHWQWHHPDSETSDSDSESDVATGTVAVPVP